MSNTKSLGNTSFWSVLDTLTYPYTSIAQSLLFAKYKSVHFRKRQLDMIILNFLKNFEPKTLKFFLDFTVTMWYTITSVQMICAVSSAG